ncbi:cytochrome c family protein [Gemmata sp. JC673]|uniref:Cytochrome c family protein n=1 Tax=Gemmata algarum TaxID=2975278 RepID=A0ABU5EXV6_9BACT|nr:multiheme c-type cytochrome [Gemmata algarum]MDY3559774.1 cytochrome c family protein [Gemmata algarum]
MRAVPLVAMALAAGVVAGGLNAVRSSQTPTRPPELASAVGAAGDKPYGVGAAPFAHRPSTSCAASACHGGGAIGKVGSEHSTWTREAAPSATGDPHAKAYSVLFNPVSVRMGQLLGFDGKKEPLPHENTKCLVCHSVVEGAGGGDDREQFLAEGVGCGGCHGPADKWIAEHTLPSWKARSNESKWKDFGFVPTKNLVARTLNCASCHVGDGTRDMNHDFIAAGHPRLAFEPARFHAQPDYRKHWTEKAPARDFEVRVWVVGQAATLRAAVNLLYERARKAEKPNVSHPWPEFSGYSCFSCHQSIGGDALRGERSATARPVGNPPWEVWANAGAGVAAETCGTAFPGVSSPQLLKVQELRKLMGAKREPNPAEVAQLALAARDELDRWLAQLQAAEDRELVPVPEGMPRRIAHLLTSRALNGDKLADHDWDALASTYLGAASMWTATGGRGGREALWGEPLARVYGALKFPPGANGPIRFGKPELDTIYKQLELLRNTTGTPEGK